MSGVGWATYYSIRKNKGKNQGKFFMTTMDSDIIMKIFNFVESDFMKHKSKKSLEKVQHIQLEKKIYIDKHLEDTLTHDNLYLNDKPKIMT